MEDKRACDPADVQIIKSHLSRLTTRVGHPISGRLAVRSPLKKSGELTAGGVAVHRTPMSDPVHVCSTEDANLDLLNAKESFCVFPVST